MVRANSFRKPSPKTLAERAREKEQYGYLSELYEKWGEVEANAYERIAREYEEKVRQAQELFMDSAFKELGRGATKAAISRALGVDRQRLDYLIRKHGGMNTTKVAAIQESKPKRFTASDYKFANGGTNVDVLIHDNEGEYEDMRLLPSRNGEGYVWGYRHTSYQWPNKERIPKEVMDLMPQDEFWAFQQCTDEASKRIWLSWTKDERVLATVGKKPTVDEGLAAAEAEVDWA